MAATILAGLLAAPAAAGPRFLLLSERWVNLAGGPTGSGTFTSHAYDADGRRVRSEVYPSLVPEGLPHERREYAYFSDGLPESVTTSLEGDPDSRVAYSYDGRSRLIAAAVSGADGAERYRDTFMYGADGRLAEETRWRGNARVFFRRFAYADDGAPASDTLYEPEGEDFQPVQAVVRGPGRDASERRESRHRRQDGVWYLVHDIYRAYRDGNLVYAVTYPAGARRFDSTAYAHDAHGNRVREERFSGRGEAVSRLEFDWKDTQVMALRRRDRPAIRGGSGIRPDLTAGRTGWRMNGTDLLGRGAALPRTGAQGG